MKFLRVENTYRSKFRIVLARRGKRITANGYRTFLGGREMIAMF